MIIPQPVVNTFERVGINYKLLLDISDKAVTTATNRFTGESVQTSPLISYLVNWVYDISNDMETGESKVSIADFDRIRYFILKVAPEVYSTCID